MKTLLCMLLLTRPIPLYCSSYIVYDHTNHTILDGKNIDHKQSVASISKIMTAIILLENCDLLDIVTVGDEINDAYGSAIYLHIGDTITMSDLIYSILLRSANDSCLVASKYLCNNQQQFVSMMNNKAYELGMKNSHFSNPCGLDDKDSGNISTCKDMAVLMSYCLNNSMFKTIIQTKSYSRLDGKGTFKNKNKLLNMVDYEVGGKTGYTKKAKRTLINYASKDGIELIVVTLNCGDDFNYHRKLFDYYFSKYKDLLIIPSNVYYIEPYEVCINKDIYYKTNLMNPHITYKFSDTLDIYINDKIYKKIKYHRVSKWYYMIKELLFK